MGKAIRNWWMWIGLVVISLLLVTHSGRPNPILAQTDASAVESSEATSRTLTAKAKRVIIVSVDGLRPDAISPTQTPHIWRMTRWGATTFAAETIIPSNTMPAHTSMLTGVDVDVHGITWNIYDPEYGPVRVPTVFSIAHDLGRSTAMVNGKDKLLQLVIPGSLDYMITLHRYPDAEVAAAAVAIIPDDYDVLFVHLPTVDLTGHQEGWMSEPYLDAVTLADDAIGMLLDAVREAGMLHTTIGIVTADHAGEGTGHSNGDPIDVTIPWMVAGWMVNRGCELPDDIVIMDTAATALYGLGISPPADWSGEPVTQAFSDTPCSSP